MKSFLKIVFFCIILLTGFVGYANFGIPQVKPAPPPTEEKLDLGNMTMDQFIALGEKVFNGKGTCTLCHNNVGKRAPMLDGAGADAVATNAPLRLKDPRYKGKATTPEEYIRESMKDPSAFVVIGFGTDNDTKSPMPNVTTGSIGMSDAEVDAVIAYLQNKAGVEVTVKIPVGAPPAAKEGEAKAAEPAKTVEEASLKYGCGACHKIGKEEGALGPDLTHIGKSKNEAYLRQAILDPDAVIAKNCPGGPCAAGMMPKDFGAKMTGSELELMVQYLVKSK